MIYALPLPAGFTLKTIARFEAKLPSDRSPGECWIWQASLGAGGKYGAFRLSKLLGLVYAHRFAYQLWNGPIPRGLTVEHQCRNRPCCNPEHLTLLTAGENTANNNRVRLRTIKGQEYIPGHRLHSDPFEELDLLAHNAQSTTYNVQRT